MLELYHEASEACSKIVTKKYSTSFSLAIKTLAPGLRVPIYQIYGFVRLADEIVDTFHQYNKKELLSEFRESTYKAIKDGISLNPILNSFQRVVNQYGIERELIDAFLDSMEMDLYESKYNDFKFQKYVYGSAESVGLMCLRVFCNNDHKRFESLRLSARKLGSAFQKVNFLRDMESDYSDRGRNYFPGIDFNCFDSNVKQQIEVDIQNDFDDALQGIIRLPETAKLGVYLAYIYYLSLFRKIKRLEPEKIMSTRVRVANPEKIFLLLKTYFSYRLILKS